MTKHVVLCAAILGMVCAVGPIEARPPEAPPPSESDLLQLSSGAVDVRRLPNLLDAAAVEPGRAYVLKLDGPITPARRTALEQTGAALGDYLPHHAYVVRLGEADLEALRTVGFVRWLGPYLDAWKLDPQIGRRLTPFQTPQRIALDGAGKRKLVVTLFEGADVEQTRRNLAEVGATVLGTEIVAGNAEVYVTVDAASVNGPSQLAEVQFVEEAPEITLRNSSDRWIVQSNITNVTPLYDQGIHGEGQIVGVIDGLPDQHHCSLDEGKILFYNSGDGNSTHGTHVSCTAVGDAGVFDNTRGVAYLGNMVCNSIPSFTESGILQRLNLHHGQGARLHTNSWGDDGTTSYNSLARGFDVFLHDNEDDLVCLAVTNMGSLRNPENAKNLVAVGASQDTPNQSSHCSGGTGPTADGRRKPEIYAPGCSTTSAIPSTCSTGNLTGTSMACPAVTGTGALVRQYYTDGFYPSGTSTPADAFVPSGALVKATLLNSAVDMTGVSGYPSNTEGWGRVLADDALYFPGDPRKLGVLDDVRNIVGLSTGAALEYNVNVIGSGEKLKVTLVWTDAPASAGTGTGFAAINNLDLEVVAPDATLYRGNVFTGGVSVPGGVSDDRNNVEQVHVAAPAPGSWTVRVNATEVNVAAQGFALIATGEIQLAPPDCNTNGIPDDQDIAGGTSLDCNGNTIPDECEADCNANGIPDDCEGLPDCNANGIPDECDLAAGTSANCNANAVPDECETDCNNTGVPDDCETWPDCNANGIPDECDLAAGTSADCNANSIPDMCEGLPDCNANLIPDECESLPDCNTNGILDACEISAGSATDCDGDFVLDACEPDCNGNAVADDCDLAAGTSNDCDANGVPDECDPDCDGDGVPDTCEPTAVVFTDNFESDLGWSVISEPLTDGAWERVDPIGTTLSGHPLQPEDDNPAGVGTLCYVTDGRLGVIPGDYDVDGGPTRLVSPPLDSGVTVMTLSYAYWLWSGEGTGNDDTLVVEISNDDGGSWTQIATHAISDVVWQTHSLAVHDFLSPLGRLRIRFSIEDTNGPSFTEAAIDDVVIEAADCTVIDCNANGLPDGADIASGFSADCNANAVPDECDAITPGDFDADGDVDLIDFNEYTICAGGPDAPPNAPEPRCVDACRAAFDADGDGDVDLDDFATFQAAFQP